MRIVVCEAQVPFVEGGAEYHVRELVRQLRLHGHETELVSVPFKWYPKDEILAHAAAWRFLDLSESNGTRIDLAIGTKFPSYFVRHPHKVAWLIHQYRAAYELAGTVYSDFHHVEGDVGLRDRLIALDRQMLGECRRVFANARNTAERLARYNGLHAEALYHPPRLAGRDPSRAATATTSCRSAGSRASSGSTSRCGRSPTSIAAVRLVVAGDGTQRANTERLVDTLGLADRVTFLGAVDDEHAARSLRGRARRRLRALRRGLRIRDARSVPGAEARDHRDRRRRPAGVRRGRRQRRDRGAGGRGDRRGHRTPARRPAPRRRARRGGLSPRRPRSRGTASSIGWWARDQADHPDPLPERSRDAARPRCATCRRPSPASTSSSGWSSTTARATAPRTSRAPAACTTSCASAARRASPRPSSPASTPRSSSAPTTSSTPTPTTSTPAPTSRCCSRRSSQAEADICIGDRNIQAHRRTWRRRRSCCNAWAAGWCGRCRARRCPDTTSGFRAYTREAALRMTIVSDFSYTLESIIQAGKRRMAIAHVEVRDQPGARASRGCSTASSPTSSARRRRSCASTPRTSR